MRTSLVFLGPEDLVEVERLLYEMVREISDALVTCSEPEVRFGLQFVPIRPTGAAAKHAHRIRVMIILAVRGFSPETAPRWTTSKKGGEWNPQLPEGFSLEKFVDLLKYRLGQLLLVRTHGDFGGEIKKFEEGDGWLNLEFPQRLQKPVVADEVRYSN